MNNKNPCGTAAHESPTRPTRAATSEAHGGQHSGHRNAEWTVEQSAGQRSGLGKTGHAGTRTADSGVGCEIESGARGNRTREVRRKEKSDAANWEGSGVEIGNHSRVRTQTAGRANNVTRDAMRPIGDSGAESRYREQGAEKERKNKQRKKRSDAAHWSQWSVERIPQVGRGG